MNDQSPEKPASDTGWRYDFIGRDQELEALQSSFRDALDGKPGFIVLRGESGLGKTRVAQEFFIWLSRKDTYDDTDYWPDVFRNRGIRVDVNPDFEHEEGSPPEPRFIWWGVRCSDPGTRNTAGTGCAVAEHRTVLDRHADAIIRFTDSVVRKGDPSSRESLIDLIAEATLAIPGAGVAGIGYRLAMYGNAGRKKRLFKQRSLAKRMEQELDDLIAQLKGKIIPIIQPHGMVSGSGLPLVILFDDAQWMDKTTLRFLRELHEEAVRKGLKLLILCTCWEQEWRSDVSNPDTFAHFAANEAQCIDLAPLKGLESKVRKALPGLTEQQVTLLTTNSGGNPLHLDQQLLLLLKQPRQFAGRDTDNQLTEGGETYVKGMETSLDKLIKERFLEIDDQLRELLGWCSDQGGRFVAELTCSIAGRETIERSRALELLQQAEHEHGFVERRRGERHSTLTSFRQERLRRAALDHFENEDEEYKNRIRNAILEIAGGWVDRSFDAGELRRRKSNETPFTGDAACDLPRSDRRNLAESILTWIERLSKTERAQHRDLAIRAAVIAVTVDARNGSLDQLRESTSQLLGLTDGSLEGIGPNTTGECIEALELAGRKEEALQWANLQAANDGIDNATREDASLYAAELAASLGNEDQVTQSLGFATMSLISEDNTENHGLQSLIDHIRAMKKQDSAVANRKIRAMIQLLRTRARQHEAEHRLPEAVDTWRKITEIQVDSANANENITRARDLLHLGKTLGRLSRNEEARDCLEEAHRNVRRISTDTETNTEGVDLPAILLLKARIAYEQANTIARKHEAGNEKRCLEARTICEQARDHVDDLIRAFGDTPERLILLSETWYRIARLANTSEDRREAEKRAIDSGRLATKMGADTRRARESLAYTLREISINRRKGAPEEATNLLREAVKVLDDACSTGGTIAPDSSARSLSLLGAIEHRLHRREAAIKSLDRAIALLDLSQAGRGDIKEVRGTALQRRARALQSDSSTQAKAITDFTRAYEIFRSIHAERKAASILNQKIALLAKTGDRPALERALRELHESGLVAQLTNAQRAALPAHARKNRWLGWWRRGS